MFIAGQRIGGHDDLRRFFGLKIRDPKGTTYTPVLVVFLTTAVMAAMLSQAVFGTPMTVRAGEWFIALSIMVLGMLKLQNVESFSSLSAPVALFIGGIGAVSVFKAVYIDKRELKCACVGGDSHVPLGFLSLTENLMMITMAVWMLAMEYGSASNMPM